MNNVVKLVFRELDSLLDSDGLKQGSVSLVCSRSGMGKSTLALNIIDNNIGKKSIVFFNYESSKSRLLERMKSDYSDKNFFVYECTDDSIENIIRECRKLKETSSLDLVIIDYMQLISCGINIVRQKNFNSCILSKLGDLARECGVAIVLLSQVPRIDKKITIDDLYLDEEALNNLSNIMYLCRNYEDNGVEIEVLKGKLLRNVRIKLKLD